MGVVTDYLRERYKVEDIEVRDEEKDTSNTEVRKVAELNADRLSLIFLNIGTVDVYVRPNAMPSVGREGFRLMANGGLVGLWCEEDGVLPCLSWFACSPDGAGKILVVEIIGRR